MNWYKRINLVSTCKKNSEMSLERLGAFQFPQEKLTQTYDEIIDNPKEYSDPDDPEYFESSRYFSIDQNETLKYGYCWIWDGRELKYKKGGTHGMNFPDLFSWKKRNDFIGYRGWYDSEQKLISVVIPREPGQVDPALEASSLPTRLRVALSDAFGTDRK